MVGSWVGGGICSGALRSTLQLLRSNHFARFVHARQTLMFAAPLPPSLCSGKLVVSIFVPLFLQCDGAFGGCHSQGCHGYPMRLLMLLVTPPSFQAPSPSSHIVDEFNI